jgi:pyruvate formate lyase activating enzyme
LQSDPIEKKPFSHVMPGSNALTFGMLGCDYHCRVLSELADIASHA